MHSNGPLNFNSSETIYRMIRNMFEIERNISDSNWHIEQNFMIKRRQKPQNLLKLDVSFLVLSVTCLVGTFLFYIMRLMEEHEEKVSQMFNQRRVFDKGFGFGIELTLTGDFWDRPVNTVNLTGRKFLEIIKSSNLSIFPNYTNHYYRICCCLVS